MILRATWLHATVKSFGTAAIGSAGTSAQIEREADSFSIMHRIHASQLCGQGGIIFPSFVLFTFVFSSSFSFVALALG